jgi:tricorn protease
MTNFNLRRFLACALPALLALSLQAQDAPLWLRYPAISPDGSEIVFSYKGDLFKVPSSGGAAQALTLHEARDFMPVWSHDGKSIAFASDRYGNFDVFVMPATGGPATRLTHHSAGDFPSDFTPDNQSVIFSSARLDAASNQQFPTAGLPELYSVSISGGTPKMLLTTPAEYARFNAAGNLLVFHDRKGYEDEFRKHHTSSVTRDVWSYDLKTAQYTQLTSFEGEDRNPVFAPNQEALYYLSEANGDFNVYRMPLGGRGPLVQLTQFEKHPVRNLTVSKNGTLCFSWNGEIYTLREGEQPKKVAIAIAADERFNPERIEKVNKGLTEYDLSPNGKEFAFVFRGEVFVSSVAEGTTKRITNTPEQERSVSFSPDGRSLLYAGERDGSWNIYQTSIVRPEEKFFFHSTLLREEPLIATPAEEFQPAYSPDGKEVAYLEERTALKVVNLATKQSRLVLGPEHNYSYSDGDQHFEWSPDSKWLLAQFLQPNQWTPQAGLVNASGKDPVVNLTQSGYNDYRPRWMMDGKMMLWFSNRDGMKNHGSWGAQGDAYGMFFSREAYDRFKLSKEDFELLKESEKEKEKNNGDKKDEAKDKPIDPLKLDLQNLDDRKTRLTIHSSALSDAILSKDGEKLFYLARFEKGLDLWQTELRSKETKILAKLGANNAGGLELDKEGKNIFLIADGAVHKIEAEGGKKETLKVNGEMILNESAERAYLFEHAWRQVLKKFYLPGLHGVDWDFYKKEYARFLPHINNNHDFAELLSEMLGELNASHTGGRFRPQSETGDQTAALGVFFDENYSGQGMKILEIMAKSPLAKSDSKIKAGVVIEKIDGVEISPRVNYYSLLNRKDGKNTLLSLYDPASKQRWDETAKPIALGAEWELRYQRWVENCRKIVETASNGEIGYVHVRGMNDESFRTVYEETLGKNGGKKALVVDTRFNGGGWLHDDLATFLSGKTYMTFMPRGQNIGEEPQFKWRRPSAVVMSEGNYSDAHMFPFAYKELNIGPLIGMPVPGTGTAVWWETLQNGMVFGIPQVGMLMNDGNYMENTQLEPDLKVPNEPGVVSKGKDQQLEAAVRELKKRMR